MALLFLAGLTGGARPAEASGLTIHAGAILDLNTAKLDLGCRDLTIETGGVLDLASGSVEQCGTLSILPGGQLIGPLSSIQFCADTDNDGLPDALETGCTSPTDADSDEDGIADGTEDANHNGVVDPGETDPCRIDTDGDSIQDGTELGYTLETMTSDTNTTLFQPDLDPSTTTDPLNRDTDGDGIEDGIEDANHNGRRDPGESDPNNSYKKILPAIYLLLFDTPTEKNPTATLPGIYFLLLGESSP